MNRVHAFDAWKRIVASTLVALAALAVAPRALAGGFFLTDRGVRPLGRGGAFIAGADDPSALWYNPAGIAFAGRQLMVDASWNVLAADFTRVDSGGNVLPTVSASVTPIPVAGIAYTENFGLRELTVGLGVFAPNALLLSWPEQITVMGGIQPAPQRYSLLTLNGSFVAPIVLGAAWRPIPQLSIGITGELLVAAFHARSTLSACDGVICTQPENPEYASVSEVALDGAVARTASLGVIWEPAREVRIGASVHLPYAIAGDATIRVRLPSAPAFDGAIVDGDKAHVGLDFPWSFKAGVELRAIEHLRVEAALVWETWSVQRNLVIDPHDVYLRNVLAAGDYQVGPIIVPRHMVDTFSARLGAEYDVSPVQIRAGLSYENGAFSNAYLTPLTLDSDKVVFSLGAGVEVTRGLFIDAIVGQVFLFRREVTNSAVPQSNPIRPAVSSSVHVGNGTYAMDDWVLGLGLRWKADPVPPPAPDANG